MPSETQLREIFDALGDGVFVADAQGAYIDVNRVACAMLGYPKAEILQLSLADLLDASEWKRLPTAIASYGDGAVKRSVSDLGAPPPIMARARVIASNGSCDSVGEITAALVNEGLVSSGRNLFSLSDLLELKRLMRAAPKA